MVIRIPKYKSRVCGKGRSLNCFFVVFLLRNSLVVLVGYFAGVLTHLTRKQSFRYPLNSENLVGLPVRQTDRPSSPLGVSINKALSIADRNGPV